MRRARSITATSRMMAMVAIFQCAPWVAKGDLIVEIDSISMQAGSVGSVDVWVRSTSTDTFSIVAYLFQIQSIFSNSGDLEFQASSDSMLLNRQNNLEQLESTYVFAGRARPENFIVVTANPDSTLLSGGDESTVGNVTITSADPNPRYLLARLELQHRTPTPRFASGSYRISLIPGLETQFYNLDVDDDLQPRVDVSSFSTANSGIITITAVPEPSSAFLLVVTSLVFLARRSRNTAA